MWDDEVKNPSCCSSQLKINGSHRPSFASIILAACVVLSVVRLSMIVYVEMKSRCLLAIIEIKVATVFLGFLIQDMSLSKLNGPQNTAKHIKTNPRTLRKHPGIIGKCPLAIGVAVFNQYDLAIDILGAPAVLLKNWF